EDGVAMESCPAPPTRRVSPRAPIIAAKAKAPLCSQKSWPAASKVPSASGKSATSATTPGRRPSARRPETARAAATSAEVSSRAAATSDTGGLAGPEEPGGPHQQHCHHHHVGHDLVEATPEEAEVRLVAGGEHLGNADDQPPDDRAPGGVEPPEDRRGEGAQRHVPGAGVEARAGEGGEEHSGDRGEGSG